MEGTRRHPASARIPLAVIVTWVVTFAAPLSAQTPTPVSMNLFGDDMVKPVEVSSGLRGRVIIRGPKIALPAAKKNQDQSIED